MKRSLVIMAVLITFGFIAQNGTAAAQSCYDYGSLTWDRYGSGTVSTCFQGRANDQVSISCQGCTSMVVYAPNGYSWNQATTVSLPANGTYRVELGHNFYYEGYQTEYVTIYNYSCGCNAEGACGCQGGWESREEAVNTFVSEPTSGTIAFSFRLISAAPSPNTAGSSSSASSASSSASSFASSSVSSASAVAGTTPNLAEMMLQQFLFDEEYESARYVVGGTIALLFLLMLGRARRKKNDRAKVAAVSPYNDPFMKKMEALKAPPVPATRPVPEQAPAPSAALVAAAPSAQAEAKSTSAPAPSNPASPWGRGAASSAPPATTTPGAQEPPSRPAPGPDIPADNPWFKR